LEEPKTKAMEENKSNWKKGKKRNKGERDKNPSLLPWKAIEGGGKTLQMEVAKLDSF
jgi:hypothetical protein